MSTETPRIDRIAFMARFKRDALGTFEAVHADSARQLERELTAAQSTIAEQAKEIERLREALGLVCDLASQEWQEEDGSRKAATDNSGARLWFVGADVMQAARRALGEEG